MAGVRIARTKLQKAAIAFVLEGIYPPLEQAALDLARAKVRARKARERWKVKQREKR